MSKDRRSVVTGENGEVKLPAKNLANVRLLIAEKEGLTGSIGLLSVQGRDKFEIKLWPKRELQQSLPPPAPMPGPHWTPPPVWQPEPALVIGLGGTGRHVLTHLKKNLLDAGAGEISPEVRLVLLDSADYELLNGEKVPVSFAGVSLAPQDVVELGEDLRGMNDALAEDPTCEPEIGTWFPVLEYKANLGYDELNLTHGTRQRRPPVRAALIRDLQKGISQQGVNVVLVIDHSPSMSEPFAADADPITKMEAAVQAAYLFIDQLDLSVDRVAAVRFDETAAAISPFSQNLGEIKAAMAQQPFGSGTAIHAGLAEAQRLLATLNSEAGSNVVILVTDGQSSVPDALKAASLLRGTGASLVTVGIGDADDTVLQSIASVADAKPRYYHAGNTHELSQIYIDLGRNVGEGSRLWRLLRGAARSARKGDSLRVILVGSLAGGFGSAVVSDLAYLARRAGRDAGATSVSVEAYLATSGVFGGVTARPEINAINTYASLREIERFQLAQAFPFRMIYKAGAEGPEKPILAGSIDWRLVDDLYLFDEVPPGQPSPALGVFPAMADAITFWLDKAARTGFLGEYRRNVQGDVAGEHRTRGRAAVGSFGVYAYRLPMRDIFDLLKTRWVRELIYSVFVGAGTGDIRLDAALDQEDEVASVSTHVLQFLMGGAGFEEPACPAVAQVIGRIAYEGTLEDLEEEYNKSPIKDPEAEASSFRAYLSAAVLTVLNGHSTSQVTTARGGKIGYALLFLHSLRKDLDQAVANLGAALPALAQMALIYQGLVDEVRYDVIRQAGYLTNRLMLDESPKPGIYEHLENLEAECKERLEQIGGLVTRHYVFFEDLLERWYSEYFSDAAFRDEALRRLFWTTDSGGHVALALKSWGDHVLGFTPVSMQFFISELLRLSGYAGRRMLERETLGSVLGETALNPAGLDETAANLRNGSRPLLRYKPEDANNLKYVMLLGANPTVGRKQELAKLVARDLPSPSLLRSIDITDPYSLIVAQVVDVIPVSAMPSLDAWEQVYRTWYGLVVGRSAEARSESTAIFRAEKVALSIERRLGELNEAYRTLRPIVVSALDNDDVARQYALALSAGWVRPREGNVRIVLPGGAPAVELATPLTSVPALVAGFVLYSVRASAAQMQAVQSALEAAGEDTLEAWRQWTTDGWRRQQSVAALLSSGQEGADLASVVAIFTRDEVRARVERANN